MKKRITAVLLIGLSVLWAGTSFAAGEKDLSNNIQQNSVVCQQKITTLEEKLGTLEEKVGNLEAELQHKTAVGVAEDRQDTYPNESNPDWWKHFDEEFHDY